MNEQELIQLAMKLAIAMKAVDPTPSPYRVHGPGGVFSQPGVDQNIFNATVKPLSGLAARMPVARSNFINPIFEILTGVTGTTGDLPDGPCDDSIIAGQPKVCNQTWPFGRLTMESQIMQLDRAGELINRAEFVDYRLVGDLSASEPGVELASATDMMRSEAKAKLWALGYSFHRFYGPLLYTGTPSNNTNGGYAEFFGLDEIINTGKVDAFSGDACRAADSVIKSFGGQQISDAAVTFVTLITETIRYLRRLAVQTGLDPLQLAIVMAPDAFLEASSVWPCAYDTYRCSVANDATGRIVIDGRAQEQMIQAMRDGSYLLVDGVKVEVIQDDYIPETEVSPGVFQSDIYIVPMVAGGQKVLYWEYFNLAGPYGMEEAAREMAPDGFFKVLNGGLYWLTRKAPTNECVQVRLGAKPRVILRTPYLAARLTGVRYSPLIKQRSPFPGNDGFYNGGAYIWPEPTFYTS